MDLLKKHGLRDTQSRRIVVEALRRIGKPSTVSRIRDCIARSGSTVNLVTIYRVLSSLEGANLVHRLSDDGLVSLCSLSDARGHHCLLRCRSCGFVEELSDPALCGAENALARRANFLPTQHVSEIVGLCSSCVS